MFRSLIWLSFYYLIWSYTWNHLHLGKSWTSALAGPEVKERLILLMFFSVYLYRNLKVFMILNFKLLILKNMVINLNFLR